MKILFCGLGSIGKRHARLLRDNYDHELVAMRSHKGQEENDLGIDEIKTWEEVEKSGIDVAFITNPTGCHVETAIECARRGINLFIEKPIGSSADNLDVLLGLVREKRLTAYVAYQMRFHPVIRKLKEILDGKRVLHSRIVCSSYLPEWRNDQDHRKSYSSFRSMGGGVVLDLSHEVDYAKYLFGSIRKIDGKHGRMADITVDSDDYADMILTHEESVTNIHLSYLGRRPCRTIEIDLEGAHVRADLLRGIIDIYDGKERFESEYSADVDDICLTQLRYFLDNVSNPQLDNNLFEAQDVFRKIVEFGESR